MKQTMTQNDFEAFIPKLIEVFNSKNIVPRSCNYIVAQMPLDEMTEGGIYIADAGTKNYDPSMGRNGYGVIIAVPNNVGDDPSYSDIRPGMHVLYNASGRYYIPVGAVRHALKVPDFPENILYTVPDSEILFSVPNE